MTAGIDQSSFVLKEVFAEGEPNSLMSWYASTGKREEHGRKLAISLDNIYEVVSPRLLQARMMVAEPS